MKIGSKIALFYTLLSVLTTIIIIAVFYLFSTQFINKLYASYLREKAYLTAQKHWEKDEIDEQSYQIIQRKYDELLPEAHEILLNTKTSWEPPFIIPIMKEISSSSSCPGMCTVQKSKNTSCFSPSFWFYSVPS